MCRHLLGDSTEVRFADENMVLRVGSRNPLSLTFESSSEGVDCSPSAGVVNRALKVYEGVVMRSRRG